MINWNIRATADATTLDFVFGSAVAEDFSERRAQCSEIADALGAVLGAAYPDAEIEIASEPQVSGSRDVVVRDEDGMTLAGYDVELMQVQSTISKALERWSMAGAVGE